MRNSLGISAGAAGVCAALVTSDESGTQSVEYRTISADLGTHTDVGGLALSAIGLMTTQVPDCRIEPDAIAVAYRTDSQAAAVRSAAKTQRRAIRLVPETDAILTYLRSTGLVAQYGCIALADLGASGLTVTIVAPDDGTVSVRDRTSDFSGDTAGDVPSAETASQIAAFVAEVADRSLRAPEAVVLVGGGGNLPGLAAALADAVDGVTIAVPEPEAVAAKGAALLAGSTERQSFPLVTGSGSRASGALIGAFVVGALLLGYGVKEMIPPSDENYAPTGSLVDTPSETTRPPEPPIAQPEETGIPSGDPTPTKSSQPLSANQIPPSTYTYPTTTPTPSPAKTTSPEPTTPPELTTTPEPTTTTSPTPKPTLPWIPPKWPELPTWLPDFVPDTTPPSDDQYPPETGTSPAEPGAPETPNVSPEPETPANPDAGTPAPPPLSPPPETGSAISPEPGSPTPEVPDSSPR